MNFHIMGQVKNLGNYLIVTASSRQHGLLGGFLRKVLRIHPTTRVLMLYQSGLIRQAKAISDAKRDSNDVMRGVSMRIDEIYLALTDWNLFVQQVGIPARIPVKEPFNGRVTMLVNSCAFYDQNGYAVRSNQIKNALEKVSVRADFCARLGYPWDVPGRKKQPDTNQVASDEGIVQLQRDLNEPEGRVDIAYWNAYAEYIKRVVQQMSVKPTVLHAHSKYHNGIAAAIAGRQLGIPVVYEMRGLWHLTREQNEPAFSQSDLFNYEERLELWAADLADSVVVISSTLKKWLIRHGIPDTRIIVIPNAPGPLLSASPDVLSENNDKLRLAFMGSLVSYEGVDTVIEAVSLLVAQGVKISFDIFGDGSGRAVLERQVRQLGLRNHVRFHGHVSGVDILEQITNFDIFPIIRVDSEVTRLIPPLKHLEPMAAGKVVLVSAIPALLENVPPRVAQHAVPPEDSQVLAEKLRFLWGNPEESVRIAEESLQWVEQNRSWKKNGQFYKQLYETVTDITAPGNPVSED